MLLWNVLFVWLLNVSGNYCLLIENGYIQKAVNYAGEMLIIEEIQLYENPVPIRILRLSSSKVARNSFNIVTVWFVSSSSS